MDSSVPFEAKAVEDRLEFVSEPRDGAVAVEIVDSQQPFTAPVPDAQVAAGGGQQRAEVQGTGWSRREPAA